MNLKKTASLLNWKSRRQPLPLIFQLLLKQLALRRSLVRSRFGPSPKPKEEPKASKSNFKEIHSPILGTFYASPSPEADPFVTVGKKVAVGDVVGIVEAMKVMNEIKAGVSGKVIEILVKNGDPLTANQVIMLVE